MAQHTPPHPDEHINMEREDSATDDTGAQSAAAAAAAALVALPQAAAAAAADAGQHQPYSVRCPRMSTMCEGSFNSSEGLLLLFVGAAGGQAWEHDEKLVGTPKHPRCCECHRRFKSELRRGVWPKMKHHPRCQPVSIKQELGAAAVASAPPRSRKRRSESDPGEPLSERTPSPPHVQPSTRRVTPPVPAQASKKQRTTRQDERIMRLLEETHARRMAAETAATAAAAAARTLAAAGGAAYSRGASQ